MDDVRRVDFGTFVRPAEETNTAQARIEAVYGYLVRTPGGLLLLDTGLGEAGADTDAWYRPRRILVRAALSEAGVEVDDIAAEIVPGVHVIPTPGHVDGHQSLVVECTDGSVILAGQAHDTTSQWSADVLAECARASGRQPPLPAPSAWMGRLLQFDPRRVVFAPDAAVWVP